MALKPWAPPKKFRCSRCRKTFLEADARLVKKTWKSHGGRTHSAEVRVCRLCASKSRPCGTCAGLSDRVVGPKCEECGRAAAPLTA